MKYFALLLSIFLLSNTLFAAIIEVDPGTITGDDVIVFADELRDGQPVQQDSIDGVLTLQGVGFAEKFDGQAVERLNVGGDVFDDIVGNPNGPLALSPSGEVEENLFFVNFDIAGFSNFGGLGPVGGLASNRAKGEGSIAVLFPTPQFEVSLTFNAIQDLNQEVVFLNFFDVDGNLIDTVNVSFAQQDGNTVAFREDSNAAIIAGFTIENIDDEGITISDLTFEADNVGVPEPSTYLLLALCGLFAFRNRKKHAVVEEEQV